MIKKKGCPDLDDAHTHISEELKSFLKLCVKKKPEKRSTAQSLLQHKWLQQKISQTEIDTFKEAIEIVKSKLSTLHLPPSSNFRSSTSTSSSSYVS